MPGLDPLSWGQRLKNAVLLSGPSLWLEKKLTPTNNNIQATKDTVAAVAAVASDAGIGVSSGVKYGLIALFVILGLFLIAQAKTLTAAFKE